jgi:8-oxo-dGTP pyrophosphatase MutT (NUDIX family)
MATTGVFAVIRNDDGHVLCVRQNYPPFRWTLPGGRVEPHESPLEALHREVLEETGRRIEIISFIGAYAVPFDDDLVLAFAASSAEPVDWQPNGEIAELGWFAPAALPEPMSPRSRWRIADAVAGRSGVVRVFTSEDDDLPVSFPPL